MAIMIVPVSFAAAVTTDQIGVTRAEVTARTGYSLPVAIPAPPSGLQIGTTLAVGNRLVMFPQADIVAGTPEPTIGQIWPRN